MPRISLPNEHGGYITVLGATVAGALLSPRPVTAVAAGVITAAAFFARGPLDRRAAQREPRPLDNPFLVVLVLLCACALAVVARESPSVAGVLAAVALALVAGSSSVKQLRRVGEGTVELAAMSALAGSASLVATAGGTALPTSAAVGLVLAGHVAASVPLVRSEILVQEQPLAARAEWKALAFCLLAAALATAVTAQPMVAVCLVPRLVQIVLRWVRHRKPRRPPVIGMEEATSLACVVALVAWVL